MNEPGHLVAGLAHWKFGRFEVYRVNPPLAHYVAAIPVMIAGYKEDWRGFHDASAARPEFTMGEDFISANGERSLWLLTIARWACIPFSLLGGLFCFSWSRELWRSNLAGIVSLFLWCVEPNILAHGELITPDCAASSMGLGAAYFFWRWLQKPTWGRALLAGLLMGLAELTKLTWIILFGLWPLLWLYWHWSDYRNRRYRSLLGTGGEANSIGSSLHVAVRTGWQLIIILLIATYVLNLGYQFDGTFTRLKNFTFISRALTDSEPSAVPRNRFAHSILGATPIPLPKQYVLGLDVQKHDFEDYDQPSYLRGEWKAGGWWYYYLYGFIVKVPLGTQLLFLLAVCIVCRRNLQADGELVAPVSPASLNAGGQVQAQNYDESAPGTRARATTLRDLVVLLIPPLTILIMVSSQMAFNHHFRYVLPVFGFAFTLVGVTATSSPKMTRPV